MEKFSLDISRQEELSETVRSFPVLYDKSHKRFKEKDAMKNACDGVATALEFIKTRNYFYFNSYYISFFEAVLFIWLNPLVPDVTNLYSQYHFGCVTRGGEGGGFSHPFFKIEKKCPDFGKKRPDYIHPWVKFLVENAVLSVSRKKISKIFPCGAFLSCVAD